MIQGFDPRTGEPANEGCDFGFLARRGRNPEPDPK